METTIFEPRADRHRRSARRHLLLAAGWLAAVWLPPMPPALCAAFGLACTVHLAVAAFEYLLLRLAPPEVPAVAAATVIPATARTDTAAGPRHWWTESGTRAEVSEPPRQSLGRADH